MQKRIDNNFLYPQFLKDIDHFFLLNHPRIWGLRLHFLLYYSILGNLTIIFIALIFPIKFHDVSTIGIFAISLVFVAVFFEHQEKHSIESEYGNLDTSNGLLEIFSYFLTAVLIFSITIIFSFFIQMKIINEFPQKEISIDLLILNSIDQDRFTKSKEIKTMDDYLQNLKKYVNSQEFKKELEESVFNKNKQLEKLNINNEENNNEQLNIQNWRVRVIVLKNEKLKNLLKSSINIENLAFLENSEHGNILYKKKFKTFIDRVFYKTSDFDSVYYTEAILNSWLNQKDDQSIKKFLENSNFAKLVQSIKQDDNSIIVSTINKYLGQETRKLSVKEKLGYAKSTAFSIYEKFYYDDFMSNILYFNYSAWIFSPLFMFMSINTGITISSFAFSVFGFFGFIVTIIIPLFENLKSFLGFDKISETQVFIFSFTIFFITILIFGQTLNINKLKKSSLIKKYCLIILPFAINISAYFLINLLDTKFFNGNHSISIKIAIANLSYLLFIPYLKSQLIRQFSLPDN